MTIGKECEVGAREMTSYCSHRRQRNNRVAKLSDSEKENPSLLM